ncbi:hypothetical protein CTI12_AA001530 [Artemisia annua]|uniref:Uncharacterized protein n=1 Tax=Artemisia annua TaxID=35608 RepID=A0A2U1QPL5_ARTAN|nr:hypothetical protein CTI12_AA001530 [Artemisia annua]
MRPDFFPAMLFSRQKKAQVLLARQPVYLGPLVIDIPEGYEGESKTKVIDTSSSVSEDDLEKVYCINDWYRVPNLDSSAREWVEAIHFLLRKPATPKPECKYRPDSGLSAITELDPGVITGPLSSVWKEWVKSCIEFGIGANAILAVPYDWRLFPSKLEERDLYFHKLKLTFETALKLRGES